MILKSPLAWLLLAWIGYSAISRFRSGQVASATRTTISIDAHLQNAYAQFLTALKDAGITHSPTETDDELLGRLAQLEDHQLNQAATEFIRQYRASRFGGQPPDARLSQLAVLQPRGN